MNRLGRLSVIALISGLSISCSSDDANAPIPDSENSIPTQGLVAHYTFEGNANDVSGNRFHGTPTTSVTWVNGRTSVSGKAAFFDGIGGNVEVPNVTDSRFEVDSGMTISLWLRGDVSKTATGYAHLVSKLGPFNDGYCIKWDHNGEKQISAYLVQGAIPSQFVTPYDNVKISNSEFVDTWHHLAVVWSGKGNTFSMYVDGALRARQGDCIYRGAHSGSSFFIGGWPNFSASGQRGEATFPGAIDDVRFYDRALGAQEIRALTAENNPNY